MEAHPVPQNVTDFQFHLVGDMTLKQFIYLASGLTIAYIIFAIGVKPVPFIAWPLTIISALIGVAFAFLPIAERPLDHWVGAYLKAILTPTFRVWRSKRKDIVNNDPIFQKRLAIYLASLEQMISKPTVLQAPRLGTISQFAPTTQPIVSAPVVPIGSESSLTLPDKTISKLALSANPLSQTQPAAGVAANTPISAEVSPPIAPAPSTPPPVISTPQLAPSPLNPSQLEKKDEPNSAGPSAGVDSMELKKMVELAQQAQLIQGKILETQKQLDTIKAQAALPGANTALLAKNFQVVMKSFQEFSKQASEISHQLALLSKNETPNKLNQVTVVPNINNHNITKEIVLTQIPNIINGIVTDAMDNYLEGVIVVTHDKGGLPVRALKTNKLGQFIAATPLPNGIYTVTLEKENMLFDNIQIELKGEVLPALKIAAKKGV